MTHPKRKLGESVSHDGVTDQRALETFAHSVPSNPYFNRNRMAAA